MAIDGLFTSLRRAWELFANPSRVTIDGYSLEAQGRT